MCWHAIRVCASAIPGAPPRMKQTSMRPSDVVSKITASHSVVLAASLPLLLQKLNQRHKSGSGQSHAAFQRTEKPVEALLRDDPASTLEIGARPRRAP